ncbi:MAG: LacI family DNA-binding transcriptional regulator [Pseudomonadota bacterium]
MATIYDVAKAAGVSPKTVSRVMNGDGPVRAATREAVLEVINRLGYVPSTAARVMKSNKSGLLGLITGAISAPIDGSTPTGLPDFFIVQGIQSVISRSSKTLMIADTAGDEERIGALIRTFLEHRVEGLFYVADSHREVQLSVPQPGVETVLVNCYDDLGTPSVLPDDRGGQRRLVADLIAKGHRRIALLTLDPETDATRLRFLGYGDALSAAGIAFDDELVRPGELKGGADERTVVREALDHVLALPEPPSVICSGNDRLAMIVFASLRQRGLAIPEDIAVAGYDDHRQIAESLDPPLTTVELPYHAMGVRSAEWLLQRVEEAGSAPPSKPVLVEGALRQRGSVGPPTLISHRGRKPA